MGRKNKPRRRDVYSIAFVFPDGSAFSCGPNRKPSSKRLKDDAAFVDEDFVFKEYKYGPDEWAAWPDDQRRELGQTMAIRLNTRRSIRELVLPELKIIQDSLQLITTRLDSIEQRLKADGVDT
jgi:hypothetical protein